MPTQQSSIAETTLDLCHLMGEVEVLASELLIVEEAEGLAPFGKPQVPLRERLIRSGVSTQKVETFDAWRRSLAGLACSKLRDEEHLSEVAAAQKAGLILLAQLVEHLRARGHVNASNLGISALAA
jgi:hypothetical protein